MKNNTISFRTHINYCSVTSQGSLQNQIKCFVVTFNQSTGKLKIVRHNFELNYHFKYKSISSNFPGIMKLTSVFYSVYHYEAFIYVILKYSRFIRANIFYGLQGHRPHKADIHLFSTMIMVKKLQCNKISQQFCGNTFVKRSTCLVVFTFDIIHVVHGHKPISALEFDNDCN